MSAATRPAWRDPLVLGLATAALVVGAALVMFSAFMYYDDEGYVLLSLRNFAEHGGLYRDVYSQYGPFPFVLYQFVQTISGPLTHTAGRVLTLVTWAGTAVACATLAGYATRRLVVQVAVLAGVFVYLWVMASEPTHPGGLIVVLTAVMAVAGYRSLTQGRYVRWAVVAGAIVAALTLTKINIGVFAAFAAGAWGLLHLRDDRLRRWAPWFLGVAVVILPLGLMRPLLGTPWVQTYAFAFAGSGIATLLAVGAQASGRVGRREFLAGIAAAGAVTLAVLAVVFMRGTTPAELLEGILLGPLRHPANFSLVFHWPPGMRAMIAVSLAAAIAAFVLRERRRVTVDRAVAVGRLVITALLVVNLARYPANNPGYLIFGCTLPCLWLFVWPLAGRRGGDDSARAWVGLLLLGQCLHAFPVPGSQLAWGSVLALPLAAIGTWEAIEWLGLRPAFSRAAGVAIAGFVALLGWKFAHVAQRYSDGQNLGLPGAEIIRLPDRSAGLFRVMTFNAAAHADVLFSLPGMFSLNLWTDLPTPTRANVTHWFSLLDEPRQRAIIAALEAAPRACVIIDRGHEAFLAERGLAPKGLLYDYVQQAFTPAFTIDRFEFCVRRGRTITPFLLAETRVRAADATTPNAENTLLTFSMLVPPRRPIARVLLTSFDPNRPLTLQEDTARAEFTPINPRGEPSGPARSAAWPLTPDGPVSVAFFFDREKFPRLAPEATLVLQDETGAEIGLARVRP